MVWYDGHKMYILDLMRDLGIKCYASSALFDAVNLDCIVEPGKVTETYLTVHPEIVAMRRALPKKHFNFGAYAKHVKRARKSTIIEEYFSSLFEQRVERFEKRFRLAGESVDKVYKLGPASANAPSAFKTLFSAMSQLRISMDVLLVMIEELIVVWKKQAYSVALRAIEALDGGGQNRYRHEFGRLMHTRKVADGLDGLEGDERERFIQQHVVPAADRAASRDRGKSRYGAKKNARERTRKADRDAKYTAFAEGGEPTLYRCYGWRANQVQSEVASVDELIYELERVDFKAERCKKVFRRFARVRKSALDRYIARHNNEAQGFSEAIGSFVDKIKELSGIQRLKDAMKSVGDKVSQLAAAGLDLWEQTECLVQARILNLVLLIVSLLRRDKSSIAEHAGMAIALWVSTTTVVKLVAKIGSFNGSLEAMADVNIDAPDTAAMITAKRIADSFRQPYSDESVTAPQLVFVDLDSRVEHESEKILYTYRDIFVELGIDVSDLEKVKVTQADIFQLASIGQRTLGTKAQAFGLNPATIGYALETLRAIAGGVCMGVSTASMIAEENFFMKPLQSGWAFLTHLGKIGSSLKGVAYVIEMFKWVFGSVIYKATGADPFNEHLAHQAALLLRGFDIADHYREKGGQEGYEHERVLRDISVIKSKAGLYDDTKAATSVIARLNNIERDARTVVVSSQAHSVPLCVGVVGGAGTGKTTVLPVLLQAYHEYCKHMAGIGKLDPAVINTDHEDLYRTTFDETMVHNLNLVDEFDETYKGQPYTFISEFLTSNSRATREIEEQKFLRLIDTAPFVVNKAFDDKGYWSYKQSVVMFTSNNLELRPQTLADPDALSRRVHVKVLAVTTYRQGKLVTVYKTSGAFVQTIIANFPNLFKNVRRDNANSFGEVTAFELSLTQLVFVMYRVNILINESSGSLTQMLKDSIDTDVLDDFLVETPEKAVASDSDLATLRAQAPKMPAAQFGKLVDCYRMSDDVRNELLAINRMKFGDSVMNNRSFNCEFILKNMRLTVEDEMSSEVEKFFKSRLHRFSSEHLMSRCVTVEVDQMSYDVPQAIMELVKPIYVSNLIRAIIACPKNRRVNLSVVDQLQEGEDVGTALNRASWRDAEAEGFNIPLQEWRDATRSINVHVKTWTEVEEEYKTAFNLGIFFVKICVVTFSVSFAINFFLNIMQEKFGFGSNEAESKTLYSIKRPRLPAGQEGRKVIPVRAIAQGGNNLVDATAKDRQSMFRVAINGVEGEAVTYGTFVGPRDLMIPYHTTMQTGVCSIDLYDGEWVHCEVEDIVGDSERDVAIIRLKPTSRCYKSLLKRFISEEYDLSTMSGLQVTLIENVSNGTVVHHTGHVTSRGITRYAVPKTDEIMNVDTYVVSFRGAPGRCGNLYAIELNGTAAYIGMHVAGNYTNSFSSLLTREYIIRLINSFDAGAVAQNAVQSTKLYGDVDETVEFTPVDDVYHGLRVIGEVPDKYAMRDSRRIQVRPSIMMKRSVCTRNTAYMGRPGTNDDPLISGLAKLGPRVEYERPIPYLDEVEAVLEEAYPPQKTKRLTIEEAIQGNFDMPGLDSHTSVGPIWMCSAKNKKVDHLVGEPGSYLPTNEFRAVIEECIERLERGESLNLLHGAALKREPRVIKKWVNCQTGEEFDSYREAAMSHGIEIPDRSQFIGDWTDASEPNTEGLVGYKTKQARVFFAGQFHATVLGRVLLGEFIAAMMSRPGEGWCGVGINAHGKDWAKLRARLLSKSDKVLCTDMSNFDGSIPRNLADAALNWVVKWVGRDEVAIRALMKDIVQAKILVGNKILLMNGQNPSGNFMTAIWNSIILVMMYVTSTQAVAEDLGITVGGEPFSFAEHAAIFVYGDDGIVSYALTDMGDFPVDRLPQKVMELYGMTMTPADKVGDVKLMSIDDADFLSRSFRVDAGFVHAPLSKQRIQEICMFDKKTVVVGDNSILQACLISTFLEMTHWGRQEYEKLRNFYLRNYSLNEMGLRIPTWVESYKTRMSLRFA